MSDASPFRYRDYRVFDRAQAEEARAFVLRHDETASF